jgi:protein-disulfide isomerase
MHSIFAGIIFTGLILFSNPSLHAQTAKPLANELATIDGVAITETQVRSNAARELEALELQKIKQKVIYARYENDVLKKYLSQLVEKKLLESEAAKRKVTSEDLLKAEVDSQVKDPTEEEIDNVYKINADRIQKPKEEVADQIKEFLKERNGIQLRAALINKLEKERQINLFLKPYRSDVDAAGRPSIGPASAPVTIVTFADFQCPYCKDISPTFKQAIQIYGDKVRLVFRQFPIANIHPYAQKAAEASLCAANQQKFWEMHDLLFKNQSLLAVPDLKNRAKDLGLDMDAFNACLDGNRSAALIHEDWIAAFHAGTDGTPSTFINGRFINGAMPFKDLAAMIDEELAQQEPPAKPASPESKKK